MRIKRKILFALTFLAMLSMLASVMAVLPAEGSWVWKSPMGKARSGLGVATVGDKIYAIGGTNQGILGINEEFDPITNSWTAKSPMPTPRSNFGIAIYENKIYCIGGQDSNLSATGANEVYDPVTDSWETKVSMPTPAIGIRANAFDKKIFVVGGFNDRKLSLNQVYDPASDSWSTKASIPVPVYSYASVVHKEKIYFFTSNLTQIYSVGKDEWEMGTPSPYPVILAAAGLTSGVTAPERIYIFGADAQSPFWQLNTKGFLTQSYDPDNNIWALHGAMPSGKYAAEVAMWNDLLYVIGGFNTEFPSDKPTLNPKYVYSASNLQFTPIGFGTITPYISLLSPENKVYNTSTVFLTMAVNKETLWQAYSLDGENNVTIGGNITINGLSNGLHQITVYAGDKFGNVGWQNIAFVIEETSPTLLIAGLSTLSAIGAVVGLVCYQRNKSRIQN